MTAEINPIVVIANAVTLAFDEPYALHEKELIAIKSIRALQTWWKAKAIVYNDYVLPGTKLCDEGWDQKSTVTTEKGIETSKLLELSYRSEDGRFTANVKDISITLRFFVENAANSL